MTLRTISYGGGVQSTAACVLATQGKIGHVDAAVFANTGDDSEKPDTLDYVRNVMTPWAAEHGLKVIELRRTYADGRPYRTLYQHMTDTASIPIPVRMSGGTPASRTCTAKWKGDTLDRWRKNNGATKDNPFTSLIGFSTDEMHRANKRKASPLERLEYPLLDLGLSRHDCEQVIRDAGLPVPPKSACWFCPWQSIESWRRMKIEKPDQFQRGVELEQLLSQRAQQASGAMRGPVYMTNALRPLPVITEGEQHQLFPLDGVYNAGECDEGTCWT